MKGYIAQHPVSASKGVTAIRYAGALLCVVVGVLLGLWAQTVLDPAVLLLVGVLVAAWFSGLWPALLAALLATLALDYFFTPPLYTVALELTHLPHLLAFALMGALFATASAGRRRAEQSLKVARDELDLKVRERTADLTRANERLAAQYAEREQLLVREREAHATTVAAQQRFRDLVDSIDGIVWEADAATFHVTFVSRRAERILGYGPERWLAEPTFWADHIHIEDREPTIDICRTATAEKRNLDFEYRMVASDGRIVWLRDILSVVVEEDRPVTLRGVMLDITKRKETEQALAEQANLLNLTHDTIFVRDMNDVIRYWNRGAEELYGWTSEEAVGQVSHELMRTVFPAPVDRITAQVLHHGRWEGELTHAKRDGSQVVVASRWSLQRDEDGRPLAILETNNDITERKRAEDELRDSKEQWQAVFENNPTMYFMVDPSGTVLSVNPFGAEQLGYDVSELVGQPVMKVFPPEEHEQVQRCVAQCLEQIGQVMTWEIRKVRKDGSIIWVRETAKAMRRTNGEPVVLVACEDVSPRKRAEAELRESERRHRHIFHATGASIWEEDFTLVKAAIDEVKAAGVQDFRQYLRTTPDFIERAIGLVRIVDVNHATLELFGASSKAELLDSLEKVFTPETREVFAGELVAIAEGQTSFEGETVLRTLTGERLVALFTVSFPPPDGPFDAVLVSIMDITARKRAEEELEELAGRLIHAQEEERSRIGRELHDHISQMLGVLTIQIDQVCADAGTPPTIAGVLEEIRHRTAEVTQEIHSLSHRLHSSALDYLGLVPALQRLISEFSTRHGIAIELKHASIPAALPSDIALCLFRVTEESLTNIAKHSQAKSGLVHVEGRADGLHLTVEDTGSGFDPDTLERKAGLGFISMRERLRVLRGTVRVHSTPSSGTRIDVWVPPASLIAKMDDEGSDGGSSIDQIVPSMKSA